VPAYSLLYTPQAPRDLQRLSPDVARRIVAKIQELETDPGPRGDTVKRIQGSPLPLYRLRIGDYRTAFRIDGKTVVILRIIHRSDLERAIRDLF
jgi:mRNA interferase RelE/StbE